MYLRPMTRTLFINSFLTTLQIVEDLYKLSSKLIIKKTSCKIPWSISLNGSFHHMLCDIFRISLALGPVEQAESHSFLNADGTRTLKHKGLQTITLCSYLRKKALGASSISYYKGLLPNTFYRIHF